jgi:hypothetical protein
MNIKITLGNAKEVTCSKRCWNCGLRRTSKCYKTATELRPIKNPLRHFQHRWQRRGANLMARKLVFAYNHKISQ